ncbi:rhodanese-like domain-containing protein [Flaviaesturariibacter amylovorans]|uniref:Rhodanese domain-containing protein n=1 Tax=Flaviaesturariibacter amylovorans TaxID=1084520 RepID=A0ABP8GCA4_9BACT
MRLLLLLLLLVLGTTTAFAQAPDSLRCLPCGSDCDKATYTKAGNCPHCGMALVPAASIRFREVAPDSICAYIQAHPGALLLDVRTKAEFEGKADPDFGTLKGAINIPIGELAQRLPELASHKERAIIVFCSHSHRSPQAAYLLTQNGFTNVTNLSGGMSVVKEPSCKR